MNRYIIIILSIAAGLISSCGTKEAPKKETTAATTAAPVAETADVVTLTPEQATNAGIALGHAEKRSIHTNLKVNGTIDVVPENVVSVSIPLGG